MKTKLFKACVKYFNVKTESRVDTKKHVPKDAMFYNNVYLWYFWNIYDMVYEYLNLYPSPNTELKKYN